MKIGIFDSGVGGLVLLKSIAKKLPQYDYLYLGDTKRVPYGGRSQDTIYQFTKEAVDYLFQNNCKLVILACNTASTRALRRLQREYLPKHYPDRKILGVIIPTVEVVIELIDINKVGVLATQATVNSDVFIEECIKLNPKLKIYQQAAPLLVPLVEHDGMKWAEPILKHYISPLLKQKVQAIILGCTHYPIFKTALRRLVGKNVNIISQDEIVPAKLLKYLRNHSEIEKTLSKHGKVELRVTDITEHYKTLTRKWFGKDIPIKKVSSLNH